MTNFYLEHIELLTTYQRYKTRVVNIGEIPMGGNNPIRIQSMTNTNTMDTIATVEQTIRLAEAGCDYVRITAPSVKEAHNLAEIKKELASRGYSTPLIADIHFVPKAAEVSARIVEKVRINPGNYLDRKKFAEIEYSDDDYQSQLDRIRDRFAPLVKLCREEGTAMRIGSNHGSLSDRILSQYGDTPLGMVESAMEFIRICADENFHDLVISMKASNTRVMIQAYRLLVDHMEKEGFNYPLHLGVTEAGDGDAARIKSAVGIGSLLLDGFGDTIRVSLTESPEAEIPVARSLIRPISSLKGHQRIPRLTALPINLYEYKRRKTESRTFIGGDNVPIVVADLSNHKSDDSEILTAVGYHFDDSTKSWTPGDMGADILYFGSRAHDIRLSDNTVSLYNSDVWSDLPNGLNCYPLFELETFTNANSLHPEQNFVRLNAATNFEDLPDDPSIIWVINSHNIHRMAEQRRFIFNLMENGNHQPVILQNDYAKHSKDELLLAGASEAGSMLNDGLVDGLWLRSDNTPLSGLNNVSFGILQASRSRMTQTEYIACPSCGRTLFDLEKVTAEIKAQTDHLKGVKIGIMGCIVNGPGEMADADFGFVGTGFGKISLYRGQKVVQAHIPQEKAVNALIELIKSEGCWVEPLG